MNLANTISIYCDAGVRATLPSGSQINPEHTQWNRAKHQKGPDKGGVAGAKKKPFPRKTKTLKSEAAGGQSESFNVTDYMDRTLHRFKTRDEAERASAGNRYTRVKTQRPAEKVFDLSPVIKKTDKKIAPGRRTEGYQNPFPSNPSGR